MKEKTKSTKQNKFFTLENIGLFLAIIACIIFWLPIHKYTESSGILFWKTTSEKFLDLKPDLISGCIALIFTFILYLRGIISFENKILIFRIYMYFQHFFLFPELKKYVIIYKIRL